MSFTPSPMAAIRPRPRSRSPASKARTQTRNRRKHYLDTHPEYFQSPHHESAVPLLHDRLIRRFQTPAERAAVSRQHGYAASLEAALWRSEAKLDVVRAGRAGSPSHSSTIVNGINHPCSSLSSTTTTATSPNNVHETNHQVAPPPPPSTTSVPPVPNEPTPGQTQPSSPPSPSPSPTSTPLTRDSALQVWRAEIEKRFLEGADPEFDYADVDAGVFEGGGGWEEREREERWFEGDEDDDDGSRGKEEGEEGGEELRGETGVQDF